MAILLGLLSPFQLFNDVVLRIGRGIAIICIGLMVVAILLQVFFRYVLGNALPWPEEAAIFLMLWMTAVIAPSAAVVTIAQVVNRSSPRAQSCQTPAKARMPSPGGRKYQGSRLPPASFVHS